MSHISNDLFLSYRRNHWIYWKRNSERVVEKWHSGDKIVARDSKGDHSHENCFWHGVQSFKRIHSFLTMIKTSGSLIFIQVGAAKIAWHGSWSNEAEDERYWFKKYLDLKNDFVPHRICVSERRCPDCELREYDRLSSLAHDRPDHACDQRNGIAHD
jgi:hypothetical protein